MHTEDALRRLLAQTFVQAPRIPTNSNNSSVFFLSFGREQSLGHKPRVVLRTCGEKKGLIFNGCRSFRLTWELEHGAMWLGGASWQIVPM
ncbi:hypothetical protein TNIN_336931 [Trichonephila inaurata madagascariensis]|uniref:Uncharacterized protein n=1 Tax=Trichonephila inaurata madagascariensis TaxID=2747483 RepID=A0A8X6WMP0_9ARAC|nr:hypothetical protein TNIN_336931 [Trichonephila inaurata madagascariensis]